VPLCDNQIPFVTVIPLQFKKKLLPILLAVSALANANAGEPLSVPPPASAYIQSIVIDPSDPDTLYLASPGAGLYRSIDAAANWASIRPAPNLNRIYAIAIDPTASPRILAGGEASGFWLSLDRGDTWSRAALNGISILDIAVDPANSNRVYVLAPEGVYRTTDLPEKSWSLVFDYPLFLRENRQPDWPEDPWLFTRFQKITVDPHDPKTVMVGARWEGGYHRSNDGGATWFHAKTSELFRRVDLVAFDPADAGIFYAATHHQGLFKSYNRGKSWVPLNRGLEPQRRTPHYGVFLLDGLAFVPGDSNTIYAGSDYSNWKTTDGGRSWHELDRTLTCEFARSFAVSPVDPQEIYAGTNVGVYKSTDGGRTWASANRGLPTREVVDSIELEIDDEKFEYVVVRGRPAVFRRSMTRGSDWVSMSWLLYEEATSIDFDSDRGELVIQTNQGERRSSDGGFRWDVPSVEYAPHPFAEPGSPPIQNEEGKVRNLPVVIRGASLPDDSVVDTLYQRPPYVSLQIVKRSYPLDHSDPLWSITWEHELSGILTIPTELKKSGEETLLYVEVRDFQLGTMTGSAPVKLDGSDVINVQVSSDHLLPALR
jgi:photosystem II stability/assembly factor-like uncharacterized protein